MNIFDAEIISFLNQFSHRSWTFDHFVSFISDNQLLKGGVLVSLLWWVWFKYEETNTQSRECVLSTLIACVIAILVSRILALSLPFRLRPLHNPELALQLPYAVSESALTGWSSFPSDHAVLFFALATGLLFISRFIGVVALSYTFFVICLPRVYVGFHYPTDIIGGALIGSSITWGLVNGPRVTSYLVRPAMRWLETHPSSFYAAFFLLTYQIADMFDGARAVAWLVFNFLRQVANLLQ